MTNKEYIEICAAIDEWVHDYRNENAQYRMVERIERVLENQCPEDDEGRDAVSYSTYHTETEAAGLLDNTQSGDDWKLYGGSE